MSTRISKTDTADVALYEKVNEIADGMDGEIGYRKPNTEYAVETVRACAYHPEFQLKCMTAGTTGLGELDTSGSYKEGDRIEDGTVIWEITSVGSGSGAALPLLSHSWYDHKLYDASFLRADTFSWHEGDIYKAVYEHLVAEWKDTTVSSNWLTEVVEGITIIYQLAEDGHKICAPDQEYKIRELYEKCGVAWYYILDTENKKFKLPRTQYGFVGLRDDVGNYVDESLPNIKGSVGRIAGFDASLGEKSGVFASSTTNADSMTGLSGTANDVIGRLKFSATDSSSTYQDNAPVQQRATQMYLYFYVGNTLRKKSEIDLGVLMDLLETVQQPTITYWGN